MPVWSHLFGLGPVWFWIHTRSPTCSGSKVLLCSLHFSWWCMWRCLNASSRSCRDSLQVVCGWYFPGRMWMRSLLVSQTRTWLGTSLWSDLVCFGIVRSQCINVDCTFFPNIASDQPFDGLHAHTLLLGNSCVHMQQSLGDGVHPINSRVVWDTNPGSPSDESSSGMP